jgi:hypothetical protein
MVTNAATNATATNNTVSNATTSTVATDVVAAETTNNAVSNAMTSTVATDVVAAETNMVTSTATAMNTAVEMSAAVATGATAAMDLVDSTPAAATDAATDSALEDCTTVTAKKHVPNKIVAAVLTRWWYVTMANDHLLENWDEWRSLADSVINAYGYSGKKGLIASSIVLLMNEQKLRCDAEFLWGFSTAFFHHFFKWLQGYDRFAGDYGYRSRNVAEFVFLALSKLDDLGNGKWEKNEYFKGAVSAINNLPEPPAGVDATADVHGVQKFFDKCLVREDYSAFFETYRTGFLKHFSRWCDPNQLGVFAFAGEPECASSLAKWVLHGVVPDEGSAFESSVHGCKIDLHRYVLFMAGRTTDTEEARQQLHSQWKSHHVTLEFNSALEKMAATTAELWTSNNADVVSFREYAQSAILPVMNSTHRVEFGVREASLCAMQMRNEAGRSAYAFVRSCVGKRTNYNVNVEMKACERRRSNQHVGAGAKGERIVKSKIAKRKHDGDKEKEQDEDIIERTARGAIRSKNMLITVNEMLHELKSINGYIDSRHENKQSFRNYFSDKRLESALKLFAEKKDTQRTRRQTAPATGVDVTPQSMRMLQLSKLRANLHFGALQKECEARGVGVCRNFSETRTALATWLKRTADSDGKVIPCELVDGKYMKPISPELKAVLDATRAQPGIL